MPRRRRQRQLRNQSPAINTHQTQEDKNQQIPVSMDMVLDNEDLLKEILLRLPAKYVIRFKSVCKTWRSIISSDQFCNQHTLRHPKLQPSLILKVKVNGRDQFFYFNPTSNGGKKMIPYSLNPSYDIVQACNGLMLLEHHNRYCMYNPTTKQSRDIILPYNKEYPQVAGMGLAFDPSKSPHYKIVCIRSTKKSDPCSSNNHNQIEVYDSESHNWKLSSEAFTSLTPSYIHGTHWNNCIYWGSRASTSGGYCWYDIGKNDGIKTLSYPQTPFCGYLAPSLQESNGHLYNYLEGHEPSVAVWDLRRNDDRDESHEWLFKYKVVFDGDTEFLRFIGGSDGDGDGDGDGDETCSLLICGDGKMRAYNILDKTCEDLIDYTLQPFAYPHFQFGETLALV